MAWDYPLTLSQLLEYCHFSDYSWDLGFFEGAHQRQNGKVVGYRKGRPMWIGSGSLKPEARINDSVTFMARFGRLKGSIGTFLAYDQRRPYPLSDPTGAALVGFTPTVFDIGVDRDRLRIADLPSTFKVSTGDMVSIKYSLDAGVTYKYCLVRAQEDSTAVAGTTPLFYVEDNIPLDVPEGSEVILAKPPCICRVVAGSIRNPTNDSGSATGLQFSWIQDE